MKIKNLIEGPTAFEWFVIVAMIIAIIITMDNQAAVLAKAKAADHQINK